MNSLNIKQFYPATSCIFLIYNFIRFVFYFILDLYLTFVHYYGKIYSEFVF